VVESLPADHLALIPELLSEAVLGTKEVNEKARDAGFDLVVVMGHKMAKGGTVTRTVGGDEDEAPAKEGKSKFSFQKRAIGRR
jgi:ribosomal RNA-processing protein 12